MKAGMTKEELAAELIRQKEAKQDFIFHSPQLEFVPYETGMILRILDGGGTDFTEPFELSDNAHRQIGAKLSIPAKYYDRMKAEYPELLAENVNRWFHKTPANRMVRTMDGVVRAFLSDSYRRIDHLLIAQAVLPIIGGTADTRFESCQITESRMYIKVVNPNLQEEISEGDTVQAGVVVTNSEVGTGSFCVLPMLYRVRTGTGWIDTASQIRRIHKGQVNTRNVNALLPGETEILRADTAFLEQIQNTVRSAVGGFGFHEAVELLRRAAAAHMDAGNVPLVVQRASREYGVTDTESGGVLERLVEENDLTLYGLAGAVARHSLDVPDYDRATELEGIGYEMLNMTNQHWNVLNQAAA